MKIRPRRFDLCASWLVVAGYLALPGAVAAQQAAHAAESTDAAASRIRYQQRTLGGSEQLLGSLVRVPLDFGTPTATTAGSVRAWKQRPPTLLAPARPSVLVLAPTKIAHSLSSEPTLYWYVSGPSIAPVRLAVRGLEAATPILDVDLGQAPVAGIYATSLADHGIRLETGGLYHWSVALELDPEIYLEQPESGTILAIGVVDPELRARLASKAPLARIQTLARSGYWYDALDLLTRRIAADDASQPWRKLHAALLDQVGLEPVAAFQRTGADAR